MDDKSINILLIEDNPADARLVHEELSEVMDFFFDMIHVDSLAQGVSVLERNDRKVDIVLLDLTLPDSSGIDTFLKIFNTSPIVPIIVLSGLRDESLAMNAVNKGAQDYIVKGEIASSILAKSIKHAIERNKARIEVQRQQDELHFITQNISDLISIIDTEGNYKYKSPSFFKLLGDIDSNFFNTIFPADKDMVLSAFENMLKALIGERIEYRQLIENGSIRYFETQANLSFNHNGELEKIILVSHDITDRKKIEEELQRLYVELHNLGQKIVEQSKEGMVVVNSEGVVEYVNDTFQQLTGYKIDEVLGKTLAFIKSESQNGKPFKKIWEQV